MGHSLAKKCFFFQPTILYKPTFYAGHSDIVGYGNTSSIGFLQNWRPLGHPWTHKVAPMLSRNPSNFGAEWAIQPQPHFPEIQPGKTFIYIMYQIKPLRYIQYIYIYREREMNIFEHNENLILPSLIVARQFIKWTPHASQKLVHVLDNYAETNNWGYAM